MSILQFIVDMKWAFFALLLLVVLAVAVWKMKPETRTAFRAALTTRGLKVGLPGGIDLDWSAAPASEAAVSLATAPDGQLAEAVQQNEAENADEQVQQIRREAVEQVMQEAARWGWMMARTGFTSPPVPQIVWVGDKPEIRFGATDAAIQSQSLLRDWLKLVDQHRQG